VFFAAGVMALVAAWASWQRGGLYRHEETIVAHGPSQASGLPVAAGMPGKIPDGATAPAGGRADDTPAAAPRLDDAAATETQDQ
jgi:hypothetical protein